MPWCLRDGMTLLRLIFLHLRKVQLVALCKFSFFFSRSMQGKSVITVRCCIKGDENNYISRLLAMKNKLIEFGNYGD
jgi:hypothetical protein